MTTGLNLAEEQARSWSERFLDGLLSRPEIENDARLKQVLVKIGERAYDSTFIEDFGYQRGFLGLDDLKGFPGRIVNECLDYLVHSGQTEVRRDVLAYNCPVSEALAA
jgi:hypothetical protein